MSTPTPVVIGRYRIIRSLGVGGMGAVFLARDPAIDRLVAIKLMRQGFEVAQMRDRFTREAQSIGRLHHPNVVTIFDVGEHDGAPFIAMEYVEGQTMASVIRHEPDLSLGRKLTLMDGLCAGLYYAHRSGIIHRDIKPANIMVDTEGVAKILDFGIARGVAAGLTQAGTVLGTLNYMSPEQLGGNVVDHRADIFSVGAVFYELLCGKLAFPGDVSSGVLQLILAGRPEPLTTFLPSLDREVIAVVDRCIEKEADRRYRDLDAMRKDLAALKRRLDEPALDVETMPMKIARPDVTSDSRAGRTPGPDTRAELARLRRERIEQHLAEARAAIERGEFTAARGACRQALIIDPENSAVPDIQDQIDQAEQARQLLSEAEDQLGKGALTAASLLVGRVLSTNPNLPEALRIRDAVAEAKRKLEELQRHQRALDDALERARAHVTADRFELAHAALDEVATLDAAHADLAPLQTELKTREDAKRTREEDARANHVVGQAQARFAAGDWEPAIALLRAHTPANTIVRDALVALEVEHKDIKRRAEDVRRQQEAKRKLDEEDARRQLEAKRKQEEEDARRQLEQKRKQEAEDARLRQEAKRQQEEEDARRRQEQKRKQDEEDAKARLEAKRKQEEEDARRQQEAKRKQDEDEQRRQLEAKRKAEERRLADEQKQAEAKRRQAEQQAKKEREAKEAEARGIVAPVPVTPSRTGLYAALGIGVIVIAAAVVWFASRPVTPIPQPPATVATPALVQVLFDVRPWAEIEITRSGQIVGTKRETPCLVPLEPGEYHVRASNTVYDVYEFDVSVKAGDTYQEERRLFPGLKPEDEADRILHGKGK